MDATKLTDEFQGLVKGIGRAFFLAAYLPALFFVALHQYALVPAIGLSSAMFPDISEIPLLSGELLTTLLLPFLLAMLMVSLNTTILKFFEGLLPWQRHFLLRPWQHANERKSKELYGELRKLKADYLNLLTAIAEAEEAEDENSDEVGETPVPGPHRGILATVQELFQREATKQTSKSSNMAMLSQQSDTSTEDSEALFERLHQTTERIQLVHEQIEIEYPVQTLPVRTHFVCPTALGNAFAVAEEYPLDRYGMDGVLFWPRLRQVADDKLLNALDTLKMFLDFQLNLSALALIFAIEAAIVGIIEGTGGWWLVAALALLTFWLTYKAGVRVARTMGTLINTCFDYFRNELLEQFGLTQPEGLFEEYQTWLRLGAFLRRGELPYWPGDL